MAPISVTYEEAKETIGILRSLAPRPNASNLRALSQHLEQKLQTIPCHQAPEHGFLGMVMPPAIYALRSDAPWEEWPDLGPHPATADTTAEQNNLRVVYDANKAVFDSQQNVRRVTEALNTAVPNAFRKPVGNQIGTKVYTVRDDPQTILADLRAKYGICTPREKSENNRRFDEPWDPNEPIEGLFDRLEDCYVFAIQNKPPFTLEQMIDKALIAIQLTGLYERALLEWQDFIEDNKTWAQLKLHFEEAYEIRLASSQGTSGMHGYVNNTTVEMDDDSITTIQDSLHSIQMANDANYQALQDNLQAARAETASLHAELQTAQRAMAQYTQANQVTTTQPYARPPTPSYTPAPMQYAPPVTNPSTYGQAFGYTRRTRGGRGKGRNNNPYGQFSTPVHLQSFGNTMPPDVGHIPPPIVPVLHQSTPTFSQSLLQPSNYYSILTTFPDDDDDKTIVVSNLSGTTKDECATTTTDPSTDDDISSVATTHSIHQLGQTTSPRDFAILDSGATTHFLIQGANVLNKKPTLHPLQIKLPDGSFIASTHTCNLNIPWLPPAMTEAHIVPGLTHSSLIATKKFCDAGCTVSFDTDACHIFHGGKLVLTGTRDKTTGLWIIPLNPTSPQTATAPPHPSSTPLHHHTAHNVYTLPFKQQQLKFIHQAFFSPPVHTLIKAIHNDQLVGVPFMKPDLVRKYLAPSPATSKGRIKRPRTGLRSTRLHTIPPETTPVLSPSLPPHSTPTTHVIPMESLGDNLCNVFCYAALAEKHTGTMYTDATGALPAVSLDGNQYYLIAYAYDPNYVFAKPIPNLRDETILHAFDNVFQELKTKGLKPTFNQFVEPNNHRVNAADRVIQTYKNHFISGLCTTDKDWPLQLWDTLTQQALITLNLLRTSRIDPSKSAYHQLHGHRYDWNAHPLAPPGTKAIIYESPNTRSSWGPRGRDAWYCGPSLDHYRNAKFYVPATKAYRISGSYDLFPKHCILPTLTPDQHVHEVYTELFEAVQKLSRPSRKKVLHKIAKALDTLTTTAPQIINTDTTSEGVVVTTHQHTTPGDVTFQRVSDAPEITTTTNPTDPTTVKQTPRIHKRVTRANTPGQLPIIVNPGNPNQPTRKSPRLHDDEPILTIQEPSSSRIPLYSPHLIAFQAVNLLTHNVYADPHHVGA
eukprot:CCRYP_014487-RA/>CCRYP_014487-RA protein AED:0.29 eAED:0.21 QI:0/0/0/1/0.5/0.33/3/0/1151